MMTGFLAVNERFRELVESFEPNTHQFIPVRLFRKKKDETYSQYYWLNICNRLDSVNREETNYEWKTDYAGEGYWDRSNVNDPRLVISCEKVKGFHLWFDPLLDGGFYCSAEFGSAALEQDFVGLSLSPIEEF